MRMYSLTRCIAMRRNSCCSCNNAASQAHSQVCHHGDCTQCLCVSVRLCHSTAAWVPIHAEKGAWKALNFVGAAPRRAATASVYSKRAVRAYATDVDPRLSQSRSPSHRSVSTEVSTSGQQDATPITRRGKTQTCDFTTLAACVAELVKKWVPSKIDQVNSSPRVQHLSRVKLTSSETDCQ